MTYPLQSLLQELARGPMRSRSLRLMSPCSRATFYRQLRRLAQYGVRVSWDRDKERYQVEDWGIFNPDRLRIDSPGSEGQV